MAALCGMKPLVGVRGLAGGLPARRVRLRCNIARHQLSQRRQHILPIRCPRPLKGMGSGSLPQRKRMTINPICIAQPSHTGHVQRLTDKLSTALSQPKKFLNGLTAKFGITTGELQSFLPMTALFFTMAFINTIVNNLSMSMVITAPMGSAGVISFLTVYAALPLTIGATLLYTYASHFVSPKRLFTITIGIFAACNLLFALCLFPNHEALHLPGVADALAKFLPSGLNGAVGMVRNWTFSAFYCLSEMWGDLGISLLFWGFANDVTTSKQAPILYPLMGIGANVAQILGGRVIKAVSLGGAAAFSSSFQSLLLKLVGCMVIVMALHHFIANKAQHREKQVSKDVKPPKKATIDKSLRLNSRPNMTKRGLPMRPLTGICQRQRHLLSQSTTPHISKKGEILQATFRAKDLGRMPIISVPEPPVKKEEKKAKPTFKDTLKWLKESQIVKSLGIMTIAQALAVTLMEFVWKSHCKVAYPTAAAFSAFMGDVATIVGVLTCAMMVLSPILFNRIGWKGVASITPALMTIGGFGFFGLCSAFHILGQLGMTQLAQQLLPLTVMGGAFLFVLSRGTKFSLFKPSEEIIFINMKAEERQKAKATVDVLGANLGKSGGSMLQQVLLVAFGGHLLFITPVMFAVYMTMMQGWNRAVDTLSDFQAKTHEDKISSDKAKELKSVPLKDLEAEEDIPPTKSSELRSMPIKNLEKEWMTIDKSGLRSIPIERLDEEILTIHDAEAEYVSLSQRSVSWEDDRESVGSSVVEFTLHKDLDDYPMVDEVVAQ